MTGDRAGCRWGKRLNRKSGTPEACRPAGLACCFSSLIPNFKHLLNVIEQGPHSAQDCDPIKGVITVKDLGSMGLVKAPAAKPGDPSSRPPGPTK